MKIAVTGATGHLGVNVLRTLENSHHHVLALGRGPLPHGIFADRELCGDIRDLSFLRRAFQGCQMVLHLAAHISLVERDWPVMRDVNIHGTRQVVDACLRCGVERLVHVSSIHALEDRPLCTPKDESRPPAHGKHNPAYDRSKAGADSEILRGMERGLRVVTVFPTGIIGPFDFRPSHMGLFILALARGQMPALVRGGFDWVDARDVAQTISRVLETAPKSQRYVLGGHWVSVRDLADRVARITHVPAPAFNAPQWMARMAAPFASSWARSRKRQPLFTSASLRALRSNSRVNYNRASHELGHSPRPFFDTLNDTLTWFREQGLWSMEVPTER